MFQMENDCYLYNFKIKHCFLSELFCFVGNNHIYTTIRKVILNLTLTYAYTIKKQISN